MSGSKPGKSGPSSALQLASLGVELAGAIGGGCLLGYWIDRRFETQPWGLLIGATVGIVGGLYNMIRKAVHESLRLRQKPSASRGGGEAGRQGSRPEDDASGGAGR